MSCTSPLTVAIRNLPAEELSVESPFSASMNGRRWATARFITRALFTTCGRNISPSPNSFPTTFIPAINGPSITFSGRGYWRRASSVSASMCATMPLTNAWDRRSSTVPLRQSSFSSTVFFSAISGTAPLPDLRKVSRISGFFSAVARSNSARNTFMPSSMAALMRSSGLPVPRMTVPALMASAKSMSFSVASSLRFRSTSSTNTLKAGSILS